MEMKLRVVGAYVLGVKMESPASVGWVLALCLGAWWFSRSKAKKKNGDMSEVVRLLVHGDDGYPRLLRFLG